MPATSSPIDAAACSAMAALSGWMSSVRSIAVPPVDRLAVCAEAPPPPAVGRTVRRQPSAGEAFAHMVVDDDPRHHLLMASPPPRVAVHLGDQLRDGVRPVADHARPARARPRPQPCRPTTRMRWSRPGSISSTITRRLCLQRLVDDPRRADLPSVTRSMLTPRPWLPSSGLVTSGNRSRVASRTASSRRSTTATARAPAARRRPAATW